MVKFYITSDGEINDLISGQFEEVIDIPPTINGIVVRKLGYALFRSNNALKRISIPKTVRFVRDSCFEFCLSLETVIFEEGSELQEIGRTCFKNCSNLKSIVGNFKFLSFIGTQAFWNCENLLFLDLKASNISSIYRGTFAKAGLRKITLPPTIEHIYADAFINTPVDVDFNDMPNLCAIDDRAFKNSGVITADFSNNIRNPLIIKNEAFKDCDNLETVHLSKSAFLAYTSIFENCKNLKSVKIIGDIRDIPKQSFKDCINLTTVDISDSEISYIGVSAFQNCLALKSIIFSANIRQIDESAFEQCNLSDNVDLTRVGDDFTLADCCFKNSRINIKSIKLDFLNPITIEGNPFEDSDCSLEVFKEHYPFVMIENVFE